VSGVDAAAAANAHVGSWQPSGRGLGEAGDTHSRAHRSGGSLSGHRYLSRVSGDATAAAGAVGHNQLKGT
jgi:hypothetical protein